MGLLHKVCREAILEHYGLQSSEHLTTAQLFPLEFLLQKGHKTLSQLCLLFQVLLRRRWQLKLQVELFDPNAGESIGDGWDE